MFEKLRKPGRAKSLANYIIFGLICLVFVFIGVPVSQMSNMGGSALIVNNKVVSWAKYQNYLQALQSQAGPNVDLSKQEKQLKQRAVMGLLSAELIAQKAQSLRIEVSQTALQNKIVEHFQKDGRFSHALYRDFLEARGISSAYFETLIEEELLNSRFQNLFYFSINESDKEKQKTRALGAFKTQVSYISFPSQKLSLEEIKSLETALSEEGDSAWLKQVIKEKKWKWQKTEPFDLSRLDVPGLENQAQVFSALLKHLPQKGLVKKIIYERDQAFLLKVEHFEHKPPQEIAGASDEEAETGIAALFSSPFTQALMAQMAFSSWLSYERSQAKLKFNPRLNSSVADK